MRARGGAAGSPAREAVHDDEEGRSAFCVVRRVQAEREGVGTH